MSRSSFLNTNKLSVINPVLSRTICFNSNFKEKYRTSWLNKPCFSETCQNDVLIEQKGEYPFKWGVMFLKNLKYFFSRRPYGSILFRFFRKHSSLLSINIWDRRGMKLSAIILKFICVHLYHIASINSGCETNDKVTEINFIEKVS